MTRDEFSRRRIVALAGGTAATALLAGCGGPADENDTEDDGVGDDNETGDEDDAAADGDDETDDGNETDGEDNETDEGNETDGEDNETEDGDAAAGDVGEWEDVDEIVLDGYTEAWEGVEPSPIEGEQNPTLVLFEGESYDITWTNADGQPHNVEIWDDSEEIVDDYSTEIIDEEGEEQTLTIDEVTAEMVEYVCQVHPTTMIGDVQVESGDGAGGDGEDNDSEENESDA